MRTLLRLLGFLAFVAHLSAANWYVDNTASGTNAGTSWANAWQSFAAVTWGGGGVNPGDTVYISGGTTNQTYNEQFTVGASGTNGNVITIQTGQDAGHNGQVIINGGSYARQYGVRISNKSYIKISGKVGTSRNMRVTGFADGGVVFDTTMTNLEVEYLEVDTNGNVADRHGIDGVLQLNANYASSIHNCRIHDNYQDALHIVQNNNGAATQFGSFLIYSNLIDNYNDDAMELAIGADIYNNEVGPRIASGGRGHPDGVQFYNSYTKIYNNYFHGSVITADPGNSNSSIYCEPFVTHAGATPTFIQIYNNLIVEPASPGTGEVHRGIAMSFIESGVTGASNILVANNTLVGIPYYGLSLTFGSIGTAGVSSVTMENNLFVDIGSKNPVVYTLERGNGTITYGSSGASVNVVVDYNNVYASSGTYTTNVEWGGTTYTFANYKTASGADSHGLVGNPNLNGSYYPVATSSAISAGVDMSAFYATDKDGTAWAGGTGWGIGALKAAATGPTLSSAAIGTSGTALTTTFSASVSIGAGGSGGMKVTCAGTDYTGTYSSGAPGTAPVFTIAKAYQTAVFTVTYTQPGNGIEATSGGADAASFSAQSVTNNSTQVIPPPTSPSATKLSSTAIDVGWTVGDAVVSYLIYRSLTDSNYVQIGTAVAGAVIYHDTGLANATTYYYKVASTAQGLTSTQSSSVNATTDPAPTGTATTALSGNVKLLGNAKIK